MNQEAFKAAAELFEAETGWTVSIHPATNHGSAQQLLHKLLEERLVKISYFEPEKRYQVTVLNSDRNDSAIADRFKSETGWRLTLVSDNAQNRDTADKAATQAAAIQGQMMRRGFFCSTTMRCISRSLLSLGDCGMAPSDWQYRTAESGSVHSGECCGTCRAGSEKKPLIYARKPGGTAEGAGIYPGDAGGGDL